jgi:hypothetical protein
MDRASPGRRVARTLLSLARFLLSASFGAASLRDALHSRIGRRAATAIALLPAVLDVARALAAAGSPIGVALASLEVMQLGMQIGGAFRVA